MVHGISYYLEKWFSINGGPRILNKSSIEFDWVEFPNSHKTFLVQTNLFISSGPLFYPDFEFMFTHVRPRK